MTTEDTITIEAHEVEGLAEVVELRLSSDIEMPGTTADRRAHVEALRVLVDIDEAITNAGGEAVTVPVSPALLGLIEESSGEAPMRLGDALIGRYDDQGGVIRQAKGLMSLGKRLGVYEGGVV